MSLEVYLTYPVFPHSQVNGEIGAVSDGVVNVLLSLVQFSLVPL